MPKGTIDTSSLNSEPYKHEMDIAKLFASTGKDIVFLAPSNMCGVHTPDIKMDGLEWEIKSPNGSSRRTISRNIHKASLQSRNIIFDLTRIGLNEEDCIRQLQGAFNSSTHIKNMLIIKKDKEVITLKK